MTTSRPQPSLWALCGLLLLLAACGEDGTTPPPAPELPALEGAAEPVAAKLRRLHATLGPEARAADWSRYARTLHAHEIVAEAVAAYEVVANLRPEDPAPLYRAGQALRLSDPEAALALFRRAEERGHGEGRVPLAIGEILVELGRESEATPILVRSLEQKQSPATMLALARCREAEGDLEQALVLTEGARRAAPMAGAVYTARARIFNALKKTRSAAEAARLAEATNSTLPRQDPWMGEVAIEAVNLVGLQRLAASLRGGGRNAEALAAYERCLRLDPEDRSTRLNRAFTLATLGRGEEALADIESMLATKPDDVEALHARAEILYASDRKVESLRTLKRLIAAEPTHAKGRFRMAQLLSKPRPEEALGHLERIAREQPLFIEARLFRARLMASRGDLSAAEAEAEALARTLPGHPALVGFVSTLRKIATGR